MTRFVQHPANEALRALSAEQPAARAPKAKASENAFDSVLDEAGPGSTYAMADITLKAAGAVQEFAETSPDDLDDGETLSDRLFALLVGIVDADMDGEISEDEAAVLEMAAEAAAEYLAEKGVPEDDIDALLNDWDNDAAERVQELLAERLPQGEDEAAADMDAFAFGDGSDEPALDAVYKKKVAIRKGRKVMIRKRVSGTVRLSAKKKLAIRKMLRKTHSAAAQMRRAKSMRIRRKMMGK